MMQEACILTGPAKSTPVSATATPTFATTTPVLLYQRPLYYDHALVEQDTEEPRRQSTETLTGQTIVIFYVCGR